VKNVAPKAVHVSQKAVAKAVDISQKVGAKAVDVSQTAATAVLKTMNENEMDLRDIDLRLDQAIAEELKFSRQGKEMQAKEQKEIADKWRNARNKRKKMLNGHKFSAQPQTVNKARGSAKAPSSSHNKLAIVSYEPTVVCSNLDPKPTVQNEMEENDHADVFGTLESFDDMFGDLDSPDEVASVKDNSNNQSNLNGGALTHELIWPDSPDLVVMEVIEARCKYCQRPQSHFKSLNSFGSHKSVCKKKHKHSHGKETVKLKVKTEVSDVKSTTHMKTKRKADDDVVKNITLSKKSKPDVIVSKNKGYATALSERQQVARAMSLSKPEAEQEVEAEVEAKRVSKLKRKGEDRAVQFVGHKIEDGEDQWKVRWEGYDEAHDTWEPRTCALQPAWASELIKAYHDKRIPVPPWESGKKAPQSGIKLVESPRKEFAKVRAENLVEPVQQQPITGELLAASKLGLKVEIRCEQKQRDGDNWWPALLTKKLKGGSGPNGLRRFKFTGPGGAGYTDDFDLDDPDEIELFRWPRNPVLGHSK